MWTRLKIIILLCRILFNKHERVGQFLVNRLNLVSSIAKSYSGTFQYDLFYIQDNQLLEVLKNFNRGL